MEPSAGGFAVNAHQDQRLLGDVPLYLVDATKSVETAPNGIAIGMIKLRGWQVHRLNPVPPDLDDHAAYLIRVNYEFDIAAGVPTPAWAEIEFQFADPDVTVVDATPRAVYKAAAAGAYEITDKLNFVPRGDLTGAGRMVGAPSASIAMPAVMPRIDCFGLGGDSIRWRHSEIVPPGTHTGWFVLLTPPKYDTVPVVAAGEYHVVTAPRLKLRPTGRRDAFEVRLPSSTADLPDVPALFDTDTGRRRTRVFVSYAQESESHKNDVVTLCALLEDQGVDVRFDQQGQHIRRNWDTWTNTQILRSDYVIVVASPAYQAVGDGTLPTDLHLGIRSEYQRLADLLHRYRDTWTRKLLPVILPGRSVDEIPLTFLPGTGDYYRVDTITPEGAANLLRVLLHEPSGA
jgi:hypothetical protein